MLLEWLEKRKCHVLLMLLCLPFCLLSVRAHVISDQSRQTNEQRLKNNVNWVIRIITLSCCLSPEHQLHIIFVYAFSCLFWSRVFHSWQRFFFGSADNNISLFIIILVIFVVLYHISSISICFLHLSFAIWSFNKLNYLIAFATVCKLVEITVFVIRLLDAFHTIECKIGNGTPLLNRSSAARVAMIAVDWLRLLFVDDQKRNVKWQKRFAIKIFSLVWIIIIMIKCLCRSVNSSNENFNHNRPEST